MDETPLQMARRHVARGVHIIELQRQLIGRLRASGASTAKAEELLAVFEVTHALMTGDLARLEPS